MEQSPTAPLTAAEVTITFDGEGRPTIRLARARSYSAARTFGDGPDELVVANEVGEIIGRVPWPQREGGGNGERVPRAQVEVTLLAGDADGA